MIILSILIHILGNYSPKWILSKTKQNIPFLKLSGLFFDFFTAFLILFFIHLLSPKIYYIDNKDAIYGLEFNDTMKQLGFKDGDKIISINNQSVKSINKLNIDIIMNPYSIIKLKRNNYYKELKINDNEIMEILSSKTTPIKAKLTPNIGEVKIKEIKQTEEKFSFTKILESYKANIKGAYHFINPKKDYKKVSGIRAVSKDFREQLSLLSFYCLVVGILNLLPLPGFSLGNFVISVIELKRGKIFNPKRKNIICSLSVFMTVILIFFLHFY